MNFNDINASAYNNGYKDRMIGKGVGANPYLQDWNAHKAWNDGWLEADAIETSNQNTEKINDR